VGLQQSDKGLSENQDKTELKQYYCQTTGSQSGSNVRKLENPHWTHPKQATTCTSYLMPSLHRGLSLHKLYPKQCIICCTRYMWRYLHTWYHHL